MKYRLGLALHVCVVRHREVLAGWVWKVQASSPRPPPLIWMKMISVDEPDNPVTQSWPYLYTGTLRAIYVHPPLSLIPLILRLRLHGQPPKKDQQSSLAKKVGMMPSLFFIEGKEWGRSRRMISPALSGHHNVANMVPAIAKVLYPTTNAGTPVRRSKVCFPREGVGDDAFNIINTMMFFLISSSEPLPEPRPLSKIQSHLFEQCSGGAQDCTILLLNVAPHARMNVRASAPSSQLRAR